MEWFPWVMSAIGFAGFFFESWRRGVLEEQLAHSESGADASTEGYQVAVKRQASAVGRLRKTRLDRWRLRQELAVSEEYIRLLEASSACALCQLQGSEQPAQPTASYYEQLVDECHEIRATIAAKQHVH